MSHRLSQICGVIIDRMVRILSSIILFSMAVTLSGCDRSHENHRGDIPVNPDNGGRDEPPVTPADPDSIKRPGIGDKGYDYSKELQDATWRYTGGGAELKYSAGGILFSIENRKSDRIIKITDIDGTSGLLCEMGAMRSDSVLAESTLHVNGEKIELSKLIFKKAAGDTEWYHIVTSEGDNHVLVIPVN